MNLIFIYGPPAVGKTTVARELSELTGYRFFFNHLTVAVAKALFPGSDEPHHQKAYKELLHKLRLDGLQAAADARLNTIFTVAYSGATDDTFVAQLIEPFIANNGRAYFVQLSAPDDVLLERVSNSSREHLHMGKMTSPDHLRQVLHLRDMRATVPYPNVLQLDTSKLKPRETAQQIVQHFKL